MKPQLSKANFQRLLYLYLQIGSSAKHREGGYVMFLVVSIMFVLQALLMGYVILARIDRGTTVASANSSSGFYGAEAALNSRAEEIRGKFANFNPPIGYAPGDKEGNLLKNNNSISKKDLNGLRRKACLTGIDPGTQDFACQKSQFPDPVNPKESIDGYSYGEEEYRDRTVTIPSGQDFAGLKAQEHSYKLTGFTYSGQLANEKNKNPEAILEMRVKYRTVPLFQFAAFYNDDLEIRPSPNMTLTGPVHTNSNLFLGRTSTTNDAVLTILGQITAAGDIFSKSKSDGTADLYNQVRVFDGSINRPLLDAAQPTPKQKTTQRMNDTLLQSLWSGRIKQRAGRVDVPAISLLDKTGDYYLNADLRIDYQPASSDPVKLAVTSIKRNQDTGNNVSNPLNAGQLRSLRQPVISSLKCTLGTPPTLTSTQQTVIGTPDKKAALAEALQIYIASREQFLKLSDVPGTTTLNSFSKTGASGAASLQTIVNARVSPSAWTAVNTLTIKQVTDLARKCLKAAPLSNTTFFNVRETGVSNGYVPTATRVKIPSANIDVLQINYDSLVAWNYDGISVAFSGTTVSNSTLGLSTNQVLFETAPADSSTALPTDSFQAKGAAAKDISEGGLVIHASVTDENPNDTAGAESDGDSPYGFALVDGKELPGLAISNSNPDPTGLTFATNQAAYIVGDYNSITGSYQPASILADSINVLSNGCIDNDRFISCNLPPNSSFQLPVKPKAVNTTINAAFLAGVIPSNTSTKDYNGGLENYPHFHENWGTDRELRYNGSFVSLNQTKRVNGIWPRTGSYTYSPPVRTWDYDSNFNEFKKLPPMTPNIVYLWQDKFGRSLQQ